MKVSRKEIEEIVFSDLSNGEKYDLLVSYLFPGPPRRKGFETWRQREMRDKGFNWE